MPARTVFISYSHKDEPDPRLEPRNERWLSYVQSFLDMGEVGGQLPRWDDTRIKGGDDWRAEIERALDECSVCILLVSRHSLTSEFIRDSEIQRILNGTGANKARVFPIVITPVDIETAPWLASLNLRPTNGTALQSYEKSQRDEVMVEISKEIREILLQEESNDPHQEERGNQLQEAQRRYEAQDDPTPAARAPTNGELPSAGARASTRRVGSNDIRYRRQQIEDLIGDDKIDLALKRLIDFTDDFCPSLRGKAVILKTKHRLSTRSDTGQSLALDQIDVIMEVAVLPALEILSTIEAQLSA